jgi:catechol 2,3-dioxygenase-like lactoylglutathione lyase family enzyme
MRAEADDVGRRHPASTTKPGRAGDPGDARQAGAELVGDLLGGRPFDWHGRDAGAAPAPHAATPSKRSDAALVDAAARRERPLTGRAHRDRPAEDILASPAARQPGDLRSRLTSVDSHRPGVTDFVHIGLVVEDLDETVRFLALLGFDCGEPGVFGGEWIDQIIGLDNVTVETVMARAPDGSDMFEVVRFRSPSAGAGEPAPAANRPGLRHVAFKVDDVRGVVDRVREAGWDTVGEIVDYENLFLLCYVRGPEGLIVELAERLDGTPG